MIEFEVAEKVTFSVEGSDTTSDGSIKPFIFRLIAKRLTQAELEERHLANPDQSHEEFLSEVVEGWLDVRQRTAEGNGTEPKPYSVEGLHALFNGRPGLPRITFGYYLKAIRAKEKN